MRILVIAPWAPSRRRPRSLGLISTMAQHHDVRLICASWGGEDEQEIGELKAFRPVVVPMSKWSALVRVGLHLSSKRSMQQVYLDDRRLRVAITREVNEFAPDMVYFNVIRTAHFASLIGPIRKVIDLDEFRSGYYAQMAERGGSRLWRAISAVERRRMSSAEKQALHDFDTVLVSSPLDVAPERPTVKLVRSPHALTAGDYTWPSLDNPEILFVGRLSYRANIEGINWFSREILPHVRKRFPTATLRIVGAGDSRSIRTGPGIKLVGQVPDVTVEYQSAAVSIVPINMATGVQMKLIEGLSVGVPTVTTTLAASQAGLSDGEQCLVPKTVEAWVDAVVEILTDQELRLRLSQNGRKWATEHYSPAAIDSALAESLRL